MGSGGGSVGSGEDSMGEKEGEGQKWVPDQRTVADVSM